MCPPSESPQRFDPENDDSVASPSGGANDEKGGHIGPPLQTRAAVQPVEIVAPDGVVLRGQRWIGDEHWLIFVHDAGPGQDLDRWQPVIPYLLGVGATLLAVDLRGHGASDGEWDDSLAAADIRAVPRHAREAGAASVIAFGAGASAIHVLRAAESERLEGVVALSPTTFGPPGPPKLILVGGADPGHREAARALRNASIGWALLVAYPTTEQGTALLTGPWAAHAREQMLGFLREQHALLAAKHRRSSSPPLPT